MTKKIATSKERIVQFLEDKGISKQEFYRQTGIKRGVLDSDKLQTAITDTQLAKVFATYPYLSANWIVMAWGKPYIDDTHDQTNENYVAEPANDYKKECFLCQEKERIIAQQQVTIEVLQSSLEIMRQRIDDLEEYKSTHYSPFPKGG